MGRDSISICHDCKVGQANGYGSYSTWMDHHATLADFDLDAAQHPEIAARQKNQNARAFLAAHIGHRVEFTSGDSWYTDEDYRLQTELLASLTFVKAPPRSIR